MRLDETVSMRFSLFAPLRFRVVKMDGHGWTWWLNIAEHENFRKGKGLVKVFLGSVGMDLYISLHIGIVQ